MVRTCVRSCSGEDSLIASTLLFGVTNAPMSWSKGMLNGLRYSVCL